MSLGPPSIPTYVVHARSLVERAVSIAKQLGRAGLAFEWVTDFDPSDITPAIEGEVFSTNQLRPEQKSCALKHREVFRRIVERRQEQALVLEDDVLFGRDFAQRLENVLAAIGKRTDPYFISIGAGPGRYTTWRRLRRGQVLYPAKDLRTTDAFILNRSAAEIYLASIAANRLSNPIDLALDRINVAAGVAVFWAEPPLARQGSLTGRFRTAIPSRGHSRLRLFLLFSLATFRRRYLKRWLRLP